MMRNGGRLLVESLTALGARKGFGIPGESYLAALDALHDAKGALDFVLCRNEGGAAFMAAAWGKLTGTPGICFVTRGPGATNASIGVHTAMQDSAPMILFVGQVGTGRKGREAFQELDCRAVFGTMAKWAVEIDEAARIPEILSRAWTIAMSGRPGPVVVALPEDMLTAMTDAAPLTGPVRLSLPAPDPAAVEDALGILGAAERPLILIGGCSWEAGARADLLAFAEGSDIPVIAAFRYQDQVDNSSPVYCGEAGVGMPPHVRGLLQGADAILAINVRFGEMTTDGWSILPVPECGARLIHVHPSDLEIGKVYRPEIGIHAHAAPFCAALRGRAAEGSARAAWRGEARAAQEAILTNGAGNFTVWPNKFFSYGPDARLLGPQSGAMGYGLPAAIAAKIAHPDRCVVCFAGDGDFQMNCQELATAFQHGAQPVVLVLNNGIYGTIRAHQERSYPGRVSGAAMTANPDFSALGRAYGMHAERVATTADFPAAFARAVASPMGALLDLDISPEALTPRRTLSQIRAAALGAKEDA